MLPNINCVGKLIKVQLSDGKKYLAEASRQSDDKDDKLEQGNLKKQKLSTSEEGTKLQLEIAITASDIKEKYKDDGLHDSSKIAAFDFDGCLANTSVKRVGADAWSLMYPSIPEKLQNLFRDGYKLVIFTNESNIERWKKKRGCCRFKNWKT